MMLSEHKRGDDLPRPNGGAIISALKAASVNHVVALPDIVTSDGLLWPIAGDTDFRLIRICKEDEGVSICAAMSYNGTRAVLMMQQTGLMDSLNAIRAIGMDYRLPVVMLVGLQGKEPGLHPRHSGSYGVRIVMPVLDAMSIEHTLIEDSNDVRTIKPTVDQAYERSQPHIFLIGRSPVAP